MRILRRGQRGPDVKQWQEFLARQNLLRAQSDGVFGARTYAATRVFQAREGLVVDGVVGAVTAAAGYGCGYVAMHRLEHDALRGEVWERARQLLSDHWDKPFGAVLPFQIGADEYVARVEEHYNTPGSSVRPWGYCPAVSVFLVVRAERPDLAMTDDERAAGPSTRPMLDTSVQLTGAGVVVHGEYRLTEHCRAKLNGVHEELGRVVERAIGMAEVDFCVLEGVRSLERQRELCVLGASAQLDSRHLTGHAVDLAPWIGASVSWHWPHFKRLSVVVKRAAEQVGVPVRWGGDFGDPPDGPHWELCPERYP